MNVEWMFRSRDSIYVNGKIHLSFGLGLSGQLVYYLFVPIFNVMMLFTVFDCIFCQSRIKNSSVFQTFSNITKKSKQSGLNFIRRVFIRRFDLWKISSGMHLEKIVSKHHSKHSNHSKIMRARSNTERVR